MGFLHHFKISALFLGLLVSCSEKPVEPVQKSEPKVPRELIGKIASVSPDQSFVLIQSYGKWAISAGTVLVSEGANLRTANLFVSGEKLGQFAAADLRSGKAEIGDGVYRFTFMNESTAAN